MNIHCCITLSMLYILFFFFLQHLKRIIITSSKDRNLLSRGNNRVLRDSSVRSQVDGNRKDGLEYSGIISVVK